MPTVTFITPDGKQTVIKNTDGTLMDIATENSIEGIEGACGGVCSCATCHIHVTPEWIERVGPADETEQDMLEFEEATHPGSRFSCQVELTPDLDGLIVEVAPLS
ncbi:MAG: 2Fe-2S iron-sulfur cluster binding domain-containing protein [Verrucomicrobiae bacterium]|nr:2Fe-2S iron-sulfur cluster binding domain-containing protein [Verrucomicrobiae bacterium]NNJ43837.1 2Fe-2S iron-sulfur cluster binding domain-containing protein [Akkermansiaceae bacterium]